MADGNAGREFSRYKDPEFSILQALKHEWSVGDDLIFIGDLLARACEKFAQRPALTCQDKTVTFEQLHALAQNFALTLQAAGVGPRDRVIIYYENSIEFYVAYWAAWTLRAVAVPINIFLHDRELAHVVNDATPRVIFAMPSFVPKLEGLIVAGLVAGLPRIFTGDDIDWNVQPSRTGYETREPLGNDELALLLYTSGTTGVPKGVMLSSRNMLSNSLAAYARFRSSGFLADKEKFFCVLPLFHVFTQNTCVWLSVLTGSEVIIVPRIDRTLILENLQKTPTVFFGFPALYGLLCLMKTAPLDSVKLFVSGADALPDKIRAGFAMIYGRRICSGYGLTEASPVVAVNILNEESPTSVVGKSFVGVDLSIRDDAGVEVAQGQVGTLWVKGDSIMLGYYNAPEATAEVLVDGWLNTGDLVRMTHDGLVMICGRSKDLIIHKGFNIYPQEIENILLKHPHVFKAAVIGKDEDSSGQIPVAYVAVRDADPKDVERDLKRLCNEYLAAYKMPRKIVCLGDLPMNATGKVDKKQLKKNGE